VVGPAGLYEDISGAGGLARALAAMLDPALRARLAAAARPWVEQEFATPVVIRAIVSMYESVSRATRA
jgi:hypothetical protein